MAEQEPIQEHQAETVPVVHEPEVITEVVYETLPANRPRKVSASMWGPFEIAAVAIGVLVLIGSIAMYFLLVVPSKNELAKNRADADRLEIEASTAKTKFGQITSSETQVAKIVSSVDDFEARFLPLPVNGQTALYQRLNGLIAAYDLVNTTGPDYVPLETADRNGDQPTDEEKGRAKFRSLYPGVYVTATLEGTYQNLRRFIRDVETGNEFVIISSIELAPSESDGRKDKKDDKNLPANTAANTPVVRTMSPQPMAANRMMYPPGGNPSMMNQPGFSPVQQPQSPLRERDKGKMHGEVVSLHIELAAYFRRPTSGPAIVAK